VCPSLILVTYMSLSGLQMRTNSKEGEDLVQRVYYKVLSQHLQRETWEKPYVGIYPPDEPLA
jgi:hypothetical protein